jgi:hypothetical protein
VKGDIRLVATGRDLRTAPSGQTEVIDAARVELLVAYGQGRRVVTIESDPARPELAALAGGGTAGGFRAAIDSALPGERERGSLVYQLLDDVPTAVLVNGYAVSIALSPAERREVRRGAGSKVNPDLCAGWRVGGTMMREIEESGLPPVFRGPPAGQLGPADDPMAWHRIAPLPPTSMRRARCIDVWRDGGTFAVDAFFRDSHVDGEGVEEIVHEYSVRGAVDSMTLRFSDIGAEIGALPYGDCHAAASSAERLVGVPVAELRDRVRRDFTGPATCTHLNDTLRALEDLPALIAAL